MTTIVGTPKVLAPDEGLRLQSGPGRDLVFKLTGDDTGGILDNIVFKYPGWRAREGHSQPALGVPGEADDRQDQ